MYCYGVCQSWGLLLKNWETQKDWHIYKGKIVMENYDLKCVGIECNT